MRLLTFLAAILLATSVRAESLRVVTDIAPISSIVDAVMGELGTPEQLLAQDADPHHVQFRPSQARALAEADLLVWVGPALTPGLESIVDSANAVDLHFVEGESEGDGHDHGHGHGHDHDHGHDHADAHGWLNPEIGAEWAAEIAEKLGELDPANAATYTANAQALASQLESIAVEIEGVAAEAEDRNIVVLHDAYDSFAGRFGVTIAGALKESDANAPSAQRVAAIDAMLEDGNVRCWFAEVGQDERLLQAVTENTLTSGGMLDPLGRNLAPGPDLYPNLIRAMADEIFGCLSGGQS